ncbi:N-acetylmuramidase domain-containing protein [Tenacibaculum sp. 1_MG-2023]|uniref:N-acetylmuramidase domain-containing protein n=1 Tax=Tenacibaculum sp. 1_MG-2023 TaxID=3062653 RepID=UPI0026E3B7BD|nr:N-acetylmuramidase domain-containing protein [Tenacibaculum sp. 1_MG-2023]MDO6676599.1 N-acetylmuramidase domain-containing protein [Tenacibaculum sp. 1_MG-2023]
MIIKPSNTLKIRHHKVLDAYFAERIDTPQYKKSDKKEPVKYKIVSGDTLSKIAKKHNTTVAKIKADNGLTSDTIYVGKTLNIGSQPKKEKIGDKVTFKKLKSANLGDEVYVVVKTSNLANKKVRLNVKQGKVEKTKLETKEKGLMLQHDKGTTTEAEAVVGAYAKDNKITNKTDFKDWAIFKIILGDKDTKREKEELDKLKDKKAFMYLLVDAHTPNDIKVVYNGRNPDKNGEPDKRTTPNQWLDIDGKWFELGKAPCYCLKMGLVKVSCNGKGKSITEGNYEKLSKDMGVEKNVFKAVAKVESGGRSSFISKNPNKSKILYERHKAFKHTEKKYGKSKANELKLKNSNLFNTSWGGYKGGEAEHKRLNDAEKLLGERSIPIMSSSWGKFQVLGEYYDYLYDSPEELEKAQNLCEIQQFRFFKTYLVDVAPSIKSAMKKKDWRKIAKLYNGPKYEENNYHTKMKEAYENYNKE